MPWAPTWKRRRQVQGMEAPGLSPRSAQPARPFAYCSAAKGKGKGQREAQLYHMASELLQATVHLSFALFPRPGPALGTELLQVFFKVFMVHWSVAGGLTVRLKEHERTKSSHACLTRSGFLLS